MKYLILAMFLLAMSGCGDSRVEELERQNKLLLKSVENITKTFNEIDKILKIHSERIDANSQDILDMRKKVSDIDIETTVKITEIRKSTNKILDDINGVIEMIIKNEKIKTRR